MKSRLWTVTLAGILLFLASCSPGPSMAQPTSTPPVISTLSSALIHTPTPSNTAAPAVTLTQTATPSPTPTEPTATPSPTLSSNPFKPGDPTATPLGSDISDPNFTAGVKAYKDKAYPEVISLMSAVIESQPDLAPPYRYRGMAYWYLNDCRSGMADLEKALALDPNYAYAWAGRGLLNDCLGNTGQMLQDYQKALSLDPSLAFVHHNLGVYYYAQQDYERSLEEYEQEKAIDPSRAGAWSGIAEALTKLGRYDDCIQYATQAITKDPKVWLAYSDRAFCYMEKKDYKAAAVDYKVYVGKADATADAWYNYGIALRHSGDPKEAVAAYTRAIDLDPSYYPAHINRGVAYLDLKKCDEALSDFNAALKSGDISLAYSGRGDAYSCLKKYDLAMTEYEKALSLYPDNAAAYCGQAIAYYEVGRYQDALDAAANSNRIDPSCGGQRLMEIQGRSYYALGDYDQALTYMNKAMAVSPYSLGYYYRGLIYQAAGRKAEAVKDLKKFLSLAGSSGNLGAEIKDAKARLVRLK